MSTESILIATDSQRASLWATGQGWGLVEPFKHSLTTIFITGDGEEVRITIGSIAHVRGLPKGTRVWCADCWYAMDREPGGLRAVIEERVKRGELVPVNFEVARPEAITEYPIGTRRRGGRDLVLQLRYMSDGEVEVRVQEDNELLHEGVLRSGHVELLFKELRTHVGYHKLEGRLTCRQCGGEEVYNKSTLVPRRPAGWTCKKCDAFTED